MVKHALLTSGVHFFSSLSITPILILEPLCSLCLINHTPENFSNGLKNTGKSESIYKEKQYNKNSSIKASISCENVQKYVSAEQKLWMSMINIRKFTVSSKFRYSFGGWKWIHNADSMESLSELRT